MKKIESGLCRCGICNKKMVLDYGDFACPVTGHKHNKTFILPEFRIWEELEFINYLKQFDRKVNYLMFYKHDYDGNVRKIELPRGDNTKIRMTVFDAWFQPSDGNCFCGSWLENFAQCHFTTWYDNGEDKKYRVVVSGNDDLIMEYMSDNFDEMQELVKEVKNIEKISPELCKILGFKWF